MIYEKAKISLKSVIFVLSLIAVVIFAMIGLVSIYRNSDPIIDAPVYDRPTNYSRDGMIMPSDLKADITEDESSSSSGSIFNSILDKATDVLESTNTKQNTNILKLGK